MFPDGIVKFTNTVGFGGSGEIEVVTGGLVGEGVVPAGAPGWVVEGAGGMTEVAGVSVATGMTTVVGLWVVTGAAPTSSPVELARSPHALRTVATPSATPRITSLLGRLG